MPENLPPIYFHINALGEPQEEPVKLSTLETTTLIQRATRNLTELIDTLNDTKPQAATANPTPTDHDPANPTSTIELTWDIDNNQLPEQTQQTIMTLVGAGLILTLKDLVTDLMTLTPTE